MKKIKFNNFIFIAALCALVPAFSFAQTAPAVTGVPTGNAAATANTAPTTIGVPQGFSGIFSCNQNGSYAMSVGALGATGGIYVPVADATVELNTGTLVYKECVLREIVVAQRQAATAGFLKQAQTQIQTGRNGAPQYVVNQGKEKTAVFSASVQATLQNGTLSSLGPSQTVVKNAVAQGYALTTYNGSSVLACPYKDSTAGFTDRSQSFSFNTLLAVGSTCNPLFAYIDANNYVMSLAAQAQQYQQDQWNWSGGFYSVTDDNQDPLGRQILTPGSIVSQSYSQILTSPYRQLENANDLGQMVGALFAGVSSQVLSNNGGGLNGLTQPIGNQPSYLDQAITQTTQNLQGAINNAALANLQAALTVEKSYYNIMNSIAGTLGGTIGQLRSGENQCWQQIVAAVCPSGVSANKTCTDPNGDQLRIATSTVFSQAIINNSPITALASTTVNNLSISQKALNLINGLIQSVTNSSPDSQAVAIQQLNSLIVNHQLHQPPDITTAQSQQQSVQTAMQTLGQNTITLWAGTNPNDNSQTNLPWDGTTVPGTGWCNFQNQTTLQLWEQKWKI